MACEKGQHTDFETLGHTCAAVLNCQLTFISMYIIIKIFSKKVQRYPEMSFYSR